MNAHLLYLFPHSTFELLVAISGTFSRRNGLFATQEISAGCIDTLNVMSFVQLMKWDTLSIGIRSFSKGQFVVLRESTYSALLKSKSQMLDFDYQTHLHIIQYNRS